MIHEEVRKKIVKARAKGMRVAEICNAYDVGKSTVYDLLKLESETGGISARVPICVEGRLFWANPIWRLLTS